ncbi:YhcN/YlaJ family sporulation lipoprotein [Bacillus sp. 165]|uniref:YhcN/YlaJ family sporulation lipoprotein n=1 Tax=Bacillus sp. 165 TaxID=1529117 RepID=UPI001FFE23B3|nr:YhcN/YlaJ family sporulation lipoprotein [Bacillus sp. 165]
MRKTSIAVLAAGLLLLSACQQYGTAEMREKESLQQEEGSRVLLSNENKKNIYVQQKVGDRKTDAITKLGYSRKQKEPGQNMSDTDEFSTMNRVTLAEIISDLSVKLPDVTDAATLVTDDEAFIVYRANTTDPKLVADQVYKTGLSVVPRYFHVYVSDNTKLMSQMEGLKSGKLNGKEYNQTIDMFVREMSKNPHLNNQPNDSMQDTIMK